MSALKRKSLYLLLTAVILLTAAASFGADDNTALLPKDMMIEDAFTQGIGLPVGNVLLVQGKAVIIHAEEAKGFWAKNNYPLYKGDKIVTLEKGRVRLKLNDESIITLASETKLVISESLYDPQNKTRSSFIGMDKGKARFLIQKMVDFKHSAFNVKTKTAVAGVRGSEFIIRATDLLTEIIALKDTKLEVLSLALPCKDFRGFPRPPECEVKPIILTDFEKTIVVLGEMPSEVEVVQPVEIEQMDNDFTVTPEAPAAEGAGEVQAEAAGAAIAQAQQEQVLVATEEVVVPDEPVVEPVEPPAPPVPEVVDPAPDILEDFVKGTLPDFPALPE